MNAQIDMEQLASQVCGFAPKSLVKQLAEYKRTEGYGSNFVAETALGEGDGKVSVYFNTDSESDPVDLRIWHSGTEVTSIMTADQLTRCIDACEKALPKQLKSYNNDMMIARTV
jgi:hypothetical protein